MTTDEIHDLARYFGDVTKDKNNREEFSFCSIGVVNFARAVIDAWYKERLQGDEMTDKLRAAAEMALEALEGVLDKRPDEKLLDMSISGGLYEVVQVRDAIKSLQHALATPYSYKWKIAEPDTGIDRGAWSDVPDATKWVDELRGDEDLKEPPNSTTDVVEREWQGLTDEEIEKEHYFPFDYRKFARAIEAKLREKNT